jgi:1-acyl-sn-glycerol-3-phosphate acyltransferase
VFDALRHLGAPLPDGDAVDDLLPQRHREALLGLAERLFAYLEPELIDGHHLPREGGALVVGNHALLGVDSMALYPLLYRETGRLVRALGDRALFRFPTLDRAFRHMGVVVGERDNAVDLLKRDELVLVYPGGVDDSFKDPSDHYRLPWRHRTGFIRVAMRARRPIVPVMAAGIDDAYSFLFRERSIGRYLMGQGSPRYDFPVSLGLGLMPLPVKFTFQVGPPIAPPADPALADDDVAVAEFHAQVWETCQALLDETVATWRDEHDGAALRGRALLEELLRG